MRNTRIIPVDAARTQVENGRRVDALWDPIVADHFCWPLYSAPALIGTV